VTGEMMASDLPFDQRRCPHLREPRDGPVVRRITTPAGDQAWLVTGYDEVRELLREPRLGRSHPGEQRARYAGDPTYDQVMAADHDAADAMHAGVRTLLKPQFAAKRMQDLRPRVVELTEQAADRLIAAGAPADLREDFSHPLIRLVFAELLGVPPAEQQQCAELMRLAGEGDLTGLGGYLAMSAVAKQAAPDDTMLSRLVATGIGIEQTVQIAMLVQFAGFGATSKQIDYGWLLLREHPEARAAAAADPDRLPDIVEELLRLSGSLSLPRYARAAIKAGGEVIGEGDLVLLDLTRANYDGEVFDDPTGFDAGRSPNRHMTFGHGVWTCLGAPLARLLLQTVLGTLLTRLPDLAPAAALPDERGPLSGGLPVTLKVTW